MNVKRILGGVRRHGVFGTAKIMADSAGAGIGRLKERALVRHAWSQGADGLIIRSIQGFPMVLNLRDVGISRELLVKGVHEPESSREFKKELRQGMTVVEAGANIGYYLSLIHI